MAKGTKYSDVQFNVPAGADPMGIGGLDTGKSSYDPIETIRSGWEQYNQERLIKDQQRREDYKEFVGSLPTFSDINNKFASDLNKQVQDMQEKAIKAYQTGKFSPFIKTESGQSIEKELAQNQRDIIQKYELYKQYAPELQKQLNIINDPTKADMIDLEESTKNINEIYNATDINQWAKAISKNPIVYYPTTLDYFKMVDEGLKHYLPNLGSKMSEGEPLFDAKTGKVRVDILHGYSPQEVRNATLKTFREMMEKPQNRKDWEKRYNRDKEQGLTKTPEGIDMDSESYFIDKFMPEDSQYSTSKYVNISKASDKDKIEDIEGIEREDGTKEWILGKAASLFPGQFRTYDKNTGEMKENKRPVYSGKITSVSYERLKNGSLVKIGTVITPENRVLLIPWDDIKKSVERHYNLIGIDELENLQNQIIPPENESNQDIGKKSWVQKQIDKLRGISSNENIDSKIKEGTRAQLKEIADKKGYTVEEYIKLLESNGYTVIIK